MILYRIRILSWLFRTSLFLASVTWVPMYADVTVRYKTEFQLNPALPGSMSAAMANVPQESVLRFKDGKGYSTSSGISTITDFTTHDITLIDSAGKRYAKLTSEQYGQEFEHAMPVIPPQARSAAPTFKTEATPSRLTGRTAVIQGVEVEEREFAITMELPGMPNSQSGLKMRMMMQLWSAKSGEVMRTPAIRELAGYSLWSHATMSPAATIQRLMKQTGMSGMFDSLTKEMGNGTVLRTHMEIFMPGMAAVLQRAGGTNAPGFDENAPFMQMTQEVAELSSAPVPSEIFQIPEGYQEAPGLELIKTMIPKHPAAPKQ